MDEYLDRAPGAVVPQRSCQVCGAETIDDEPLCGSCSGTVDTIVESPLPPIPDGGLSRAMPEWLRSGPQATAHVSPDLHGVPDEFASILSDEDIPVWLKRMAERHAAETAPPVSVVEEGGPAASPAQAAVPENPPLVSGDAPVRRVMVGAIPPRPLNSAPAHRPRSRQIRLPSFEPRSAMGIGLLAGIAALVVLAIVLFG